MAEGFGFISKSLLALLSPERMVQAQVRVKIRIKTPDLIESGHSRKVK